MKDKKVVIGLVAAIVVVIAIIVGIVLMPSNGKDKSKEGNQSETVENKEYTLTDMEYETLAVSNIEVSVNNGETVLRFNVLNNSEENYASGMMSMTLKNDKEVLEKTSTFIPEIEAGETIRVETVVNGSYANITNIELSKE